MAYDECRPIRDSIDRYALQQDSLYSLVNSLSAVYTPERWNKIMQCGYFFKLNRRKDVQEQVDGKETIFGYMMHLNNNI